MFSVGNALREKKNVRLELQLLLLQRHFLSSLIFGLLYENTAVCRGVSTGSLGLTWDWLIYISILKTRGNKYLIPCWISKFANL